MTCKVRPAAVYFVSGQQCGRNGRCRYSRQRYSWNGNPADRPEAGQIVADGAYADTGLTLQAFDKNGAIYTPLKSAGMSVTGTVAKVCQFTLPQNPQLNFSSAIVNGLPNSNVTQTVTFTGVSCTAPTVVQLNGARLQSLDSPISTGGFDNFIDFIASAVFNSASAVLDTSVQTQTTSLGAAPPVVRRSMAR